MLLLLQFSKCYSSYSFHPKSITLPFFHLHRTVKCLRALSLCIWRYIKYCILLLLLYEDIGYHGGMQAVTFLGNPPSYKHFVTLCGFNMGVNGKIMKCAISWKQLTVEQNGWKLGTCGPRNSICRVLFRSGHLSSVWGHSVHVPKFPMLRLSKGYCCHSFHPISTKLYGKYGNHGGYRILPFLAVYQILKINDTLMIIVTL